MTFPTRDDNIVFTGGWWDETNTVEKPRLDWLLLAVLTLDLGVWIGILAWWIYR